MRQLLSGLLLFACVLFAQDSDLATRAVRVLEQRCAGCHGANLAQSSLRLDSREAALKVAYAYRSGAAKRAAAALVKWADGIRQAAA